MLVSKSDVAPYDSLKMISFKTHVLQISLHMRAEHASICFRPSSKETLKK